MTYSDATISALIDSVNSIEEELGLDPNGVYATVRTRLDILEARINNPFAPAPNVPNPFYIGGSPVSGVSIQVGFGDPTITMPPAIPGSLYLREDGYAGTNVYSFGVDDVWKLISGGSGFVAGGDLSGTSTTQNVIKLQNNAVQSGILGPAQDGYVLTWINSTNQWSPKPSSSGSSFTAGGDLTGTSSSQQVVSLTGSSNIVNVPSPTVLEFGSHSTSATIGFIRLGDIQTSATNILVGRNAANSANRLILQSAGFDGFNFGDSAFTGQVSLKGGSHISIDNSSNVGAIIFLQSGSGELTIGNNKLYCIAPLATFQFALNNTSPLINQEDITTASATGQSLTIQAQNATGTTSIGGNLILVPGTGTSSNGVIQINGSANISSPNYLEFGSHSTAATIGDIRFGDIFSGGTATVLMAGRNHANTTDNIIIETLTSNVYFESSQPGGTAVLFGNFASVLSAADTYRVIIDTTGVLGIKGANIFKPNSLGSVPYIFDSDITLTDWLFKINGTPVIDFAPTLVNIPAASIEFGSHSTAATVGLIRLQDIISTAQNIITGRNNTNTANLNVISSDGSGNTIFGDVGQLSRFRGFSAFLENDAGNYLSATSANTIQISGLNVFKSFGAAGPFTFDSDAGLTEWDFKINTTDIINFSTTVVSLTTNKTTWGASGQQLESDLPTPTTTINNTPTTAFSYAMPDNTVLKMDVLVVARDTTTGTSAATFNLSASYYRSAAAAPVAIGSTTSSDPKGTNAGAPPAGWAATITTSVNNIIVQVTGDATDSVKWMVAPQIQTVS